MEIQNVSFGDNGIKNIQDKKTPRIPSEKNGQIADSVEISGTIQDAGTIDGSGIEVNTDFAPRMEVVKSVSERVEHGAYDDELLVSVAEEVADSPAVKAALTEITMDLIEEPVERADRVALSRDQVENGYYDTPAVLRETADRLLTALNVLDNTQ